MATKQEIFSAIDNAVAQGKGIQFNTANLPSDITIEELAEKIKQVSGKDVLTGLKNAYANKQKVSLPFNKLGGGVDPYGRPIARKEVIREPYTSEKIFGPITEGLAQAGLGMGMAKQPTPMGMVASGAMGQALELGRQATQAAMSEPGAPKSFTESLGRQAKAFAGSAGVEGLSRGLFGVASKTFGGAALTSAQADLLASAEAKGIPLTPADVTKAKGWARFETALDNIPLAGGKMTEFSAKKLGAFKNYLTNTIKKMGTVKDPQQIGEVVQDVLNKRSQIAREQVNSAYAVANDLIDSRAMTDAKPLIKEAKRIIAEETRALPSMQNKGLIETAQEILSKKSWNYEDLNANRAKLSDNIDREMLSTAQGFAYKATDTARKWTRLKTAVDSSIDDFFKEQPAEAQAALELAKATAKKNISTYRTKDIIKLVNANPEKIMDMVIKKNNVTGINVVKKALGENGFKPIKQRFLTDVIETSNLSASEIGKGFEPSRIFTELNKYEPSTLKAIFSKKELAELQDIERLSMSMKTAEQMAGNTSRTATTILGVAGLGGAGYGMITGHPVLTTMTLLSGPALAKMYLSDAGRSLILHGLKLNPGSKEAVKAATRITNFAALNKLTEQNK